MGVSKLWNILEPVRKTVALRDLADQVLAIDLSIWIHEASGVCTAPCMCFVHHHHIAKRNDSPFNIAYAMCLLLLCVCYHTHYNHFATHCPLPRPNPIHQIPQLSGKVDNPHLQIVYQRANKLLSFGIRLVAVLEGTPPAAKRRTLANRQSIRHGGRGQLWHAPGRGRGRGGAGRGGRGRGRPGPPAHVLKGKLYKQSRQCAEMLAAMGVAVVQVTKQHVLLRLACVAPKLTSLQHTPSPTRRRLVARQRPHVLP